MDKDHQDRSVAYAKWISANIQQGDLTDN